MGPYALALLLLFSGLPLMAQFQVLDAGTTASLRGVDALSDQVAWVSGSGGTVLLTRDGGATWKHCATPAGAEKMDFRGVQGFDAQTAVIMASGPGAQSAVYRTTDGCATWKLTFANPDKQGFFDALHKVTGRQMYLLGDPVGGKFAMFYSADQGATWFIADDPGLAAEQAAGAFAASNTSLTSIGPFLFFGTGATATTAPRVYATRQHCAAAAVAGASCGVEWSATAVPMPARVTSAGIFSLAGRNTTDMRGRMKTSLVAVGGDYQKPGDGVGTAAYSADGGLTWALSSTPPAGYRSAVAFESRSQRWIAVGPGGTDVSLDEGRTWTALQPSGAAGQGWNALSLPFVVGGKGKVGKLIP